MTKIPISLSQAVVEAARAAGEQMNEGEGGGEEELAKNKATDRQEEALVNYLKTQALAVPGSFLTLLGKVGAGQSQTNLPPVTRIELVAPNLISQHKKIDEDNGSIS